MRLALSRAELEILPYRSGPRRARFPDLEASTCARAMQLALPDGRIVAGVDAAPEILRRIAAWRWLPRALRPVDARATARRVYGWVARRRLGLVCPRES
jgi:predicted DCC family thiol-disulfide oxidoreductase YuxK